MSSDVDKLWDPNLTEGANTRRMLFGEFDFNLVDSSQGVC